MHSIARPLAALILVAAGCGGSSKSSSGSGALAAGALCDPDYPGDCSTGVCQDVVSGQSCDSYSCTDWDQSSNQGTICTRSCSSDADCGGIDFASTNDLEVSSESWTCTDGVCHVTVVGPPSTPGDSCSGCGGALCSGPCIGCPQCLPQPTEPDRR